MSSDDRLVQAAIEGAWLTLDELCRAVRVDTQWVHERIAAGLLAAPGAAPEAWRFDAVALGRVRLMRRVERDFDAVPELAALVADLQDEIQRLRARLARAGLD